MSVNRVGSLQLPNPIFYQFVVSSSDYNNFKLSNATYPFLGTPSFVTLTSSDVQSDSNIQSIARFLLNQNYAMLPPSSIVVSVSRDFPYYRLVFDNRQNLYVTINVIFNFYTNSVQVMSVTSSNIN